MPITLPALGQRPAPAEPLNGFVGAAMRAAVLLYLPFLQMRLAATDRLSEAFAPRAVRADYRRAPRAFTFAFVLSPLFTLPCTS